MDIFLHMAGRVSKDVSTRAASAPRSSVRKPMALPCAVATPARAIPQYGNGEKETARSIDTPARAIHDAGTTKRSSRHVSSQHRPALYHGTETEKRKRKKTQSNQNVHRFVLYHFNETETKGTERMNTIHILLFEMYPVDDEACAVTHAFDTPKSTTTEDHTNGR